jgi:hypothetical protein
LPPASLGASAESRLESLSCEAPASVGLKRSRSCDVHTKKKKARAIAREIHELMVLASVVTKTKETKQITKHKHRRAVCRAGVRVFVFFI